MEKKRLTPKQKQERKEFVKKQLFKILHSIGYVCIFLVALFSILMGVQNCKNGASKNNNVSSNLQPRTQQRSNYSGSQRDLYYDIIDNNGTTGLIGCRFGFDNDYFIQNVVNDSFITSLGITRLIFEFREDLDADSDDRLYSIYDVNYNNASALTSLAITWDSSGYEVYMLFEGTYAGPILNADYDGTINYNLFYDYYFKFNNSNGHRLSVIINSSTDANGFIFTHNDRFTYNGINYNFDFSNLFANLFPIQTESFKFVDNFNLVSLYTSNVQGAINLGGYTINQYNSNYSYICKQDRVFMCNGEVFDTMRVVGLDLTDNSTYVTTDGENASVWNLGGNYFVPFYLEYSNSNTNVSHGVLYINQILRSNNSGTALYLNSYRWSNVIYQNITFLDSGFNKPSGFYTQFSLDALSVLNNGINNNIGSITNYTLGTGNNNVFVWLRGAFSSITDIFAIALLPGVTVGILIFLPMVVTIIIVIFKLIKK